MEHYYNNRNRDNRLVNTDDNRPFWALEDEKYYSQKHYDYYDPQKMDIDQNEFTGQLAHQQSAIRFDMSYIREPMGFSEVSNYKRDARVFDPSWYGFTPFPHDNVIPDGEMRFANPVLPASFDSTRNNINKNYFANKKNYHDGMRKSIYSPLEGMTDAKKLIGKPYCASADASPFISDNYVPAPKQKIIHKKKMDDYTANRRNYYLPQESHSFANDYNSVSIKADTLMQIDVDYSLPLWNVTDYLQFPNGVRKGPKK